MTQPTPSLVDLFATDALLDAIGRREHPEPDSMTVSLLVALTDSIDREIAPRLAATARDPQVPPRRLHLVTGSGAGTVGQLAMKALPRHRTNRWVALGTGALIVLSGSSLAAAATSAPGESWGPLKPIARVLHPASADQGLPSRRQDVLADLARAKDRDQAGGHVAPASYGVARGRDLTDRIDAGARSPLDLLGRQLGLQVGPRAAETVTGGAEAGSTATTGTTATVATTPTDPVVPTEPTDPTDPIVTTDPTDPIVTTDPTDPIVTTDPTVPTDPIVTTDPTVTTTVPTDPTDPTVTTVPVATTVPVTTAPPTDPPTDPPTATPTDPPTATPTDPPTDPDTTDTTDTTDPAQPTADPTATPTATVTTDTPPA